MPGGGRRVAEMMGGTTVGVPRTRRRGADPRRNQLRWTRSAAAKMPAPAAYIVPTKEPNAFAAIRGRDHVVAVTQAAWISSTGTAPCRNLHAPDRVSTPTRR